MLTLIIDGLALKVGSINIKLYNLGKFFKSLIKLLWIKLFNIK